MNNTINNNLRVNNINYKKLQRKNNNKKLFKVNCFTLALITSPAIDKIKLNSNEYKKNMPSGYIQIYTTEQVEKNDTLTTIAQKYYNDDIYSSYYQSLDNYTEEIAKTNNITKNNITPFQDLTIPTLIPRNNIYLERIEALNQQIKKLQVWTPYQIQEGDTIQSLAYKGAGDIDEAYTVSKDIIQYNNMSNTNIHSGDTIYIVNPHIGHLKKEIYQLKRSLNNSLKTK